MTSVGPLGASEACFPSTSIYFHHSFSIFSKCTPSSSTDRTPRTRKLSHILGITIGAHHQCFTMADSAFEISSIVSDEVLAELSTVFESSEDHEDKDKTTVTQNQMDNSLSSMLLLLIV